MKLLFITQKVDRNDPILGFVHNWLIVLSRNVQKVNVICLEKGEYDLPKNVEVFSLGKEEGQSKIKYIFNFYKYIFKLEYDSVFVHMNQEYVLLGSIIWKCLRKKIAFWYNHTYGTFLTKVAMKMSDFIFHTSPFAFTANHQKSQKMPAGIDVDIFKNNNIKRKANSILCIGRLDKVKNIDILIEAVRILKKRNIIFSLDIYGKASHGSESYEQYLRQMVSEYGLDEQVSFLGSISNNETPAIYSSHQIFVNMTPKGNYDKTVLEAMSCGTLVVTSCKGFEDFIPKELFFAEGDFENFANVMMNVLNFSKKEYGSKSLILEDHVKNHESLDILIDKVVNIIK